jgi:histidyl-tRNA synthetase
MGNPTGDGPDKGTAEPEDESVAGDTAAPAGKIEPRTFRGMRDFLPAEMIQREEIFGYLRDVFQRYGFSPLETPAVEYLDVLLGKYGREGEKLIYPLAYRGGKVLALRYDLTVPLARVVAQHTELPRPLKRYQMQPVWRADRPQLIQGRYREFYQCDVDIVGESHHLADAEILALTAEVLTGLEVGSFRVRVNHRKVLEGIIESAGLPQTAGPAVLRAVDKVDKVGEAGIEVELAAEGIEPEPRRRILDLLARAPGGRAAILDLSVAFPGVAAIQEGCANLAAIWADLEALGVPLEPYEFRLTLARGLDYYTGAVFESFLDALPHVGSLTGGGRFDGLVGLFSEQEVPAVGTSIGLDRIFAALEQTGRAASRVSRTEVMVLQFGAGSEAACVGLAGRLRRLGLRAEVWYRPERLKKQISQADRRGIPLVVFQGPDEVARREWVGKWLPTGEQRSFPEDETPETVQRWLREMRGAL